MGATYKYSIIAMRIKKDDHDKITLIPIEKFSFADLIAKSNKADACLGWDGSPYNHGYWDTVDDDLIEYSKKYHRIVFKLIVEGIYNYEQWITYYHNGKYQHCPAITTYDDFNLNKLTDKSHPFNNITKKQLEEAITAAMQGITSCNGYVWNLEKPFRNRIASISPGDLVFVNDSHTGIYVEKCEHYHDPNSLFVKINDVSYNYDSITGIIHLNPIKDDES